MTDLPAYTPSDVSSIDLAPSVHSADDAKLDHDGHSLVASVFSGTSVLLHDLDHDTERRLLAASRLNLLNPVTNQPIAREVARTLFRNQHARERFEIQTLASVVQPGNAESAIENMFRSLKPTVTFSPGGEGVEYAPEAVKEMVNEYCNEHKFSQYLTERIQSDPKCRLHIGMLRGKAHTLSKEDRALFSMRLSAFVVDLTAKSAKERYELHSKALRNVHEEYSKDKTLSDATIVAAKESLLEIDRLLADIDAASQMTTDQKLLATIQDWKGELTAFRDTARSVIITFEERAFVLRTIVISTLGALGFIGLLGLLSRFLKRRRGDETPKQ